MDISSFKEAPGGNRSDAGTQTPLGSPEERRVMNGIILTDYGFPPQGLPEGSISPKADSEDTPPDGPRIEIDKTSPRTLPPLSPPTPRLTPDQISSSISPATPTLHFPSVNQSNLTLPSRRSQPAKQGTEGLHILAVDDNALNLQLLHRYLQKRKQDTIILARNGVEAVSAFKNTGKKGFDVVFMDISMPEMDGFEATRLIRGLEARSGSKVEGNILQEGDGNGKEKGKRAHVVALTGLASRRDRDEAERSGFDDFLTKPVSFSRIGEVLGKLGIEKYKEKDKGCC
jgi:CheY-like chemotaxis protein